MTDKRNQFPKLNCHNYETWKSNMRQLLNLKGLRGHIDGQVAAPLANASQLEKQDYEDRKAKTMGHIYFAVDDIHQQLLADYDDPQHAWTKLKKMYDFNSRARIFLLLEEFHKLKMDEDEEMANWVIRVQVAAIRLGNAGKRCEDREIAFQLITKLPNQYQNVLNRIFEWPNEEFTSDKVSAALLLEADAIKCLNRQREMMDEEEEAEAVNNKKDKTCFKCHAKGHFARNCPTKRIRNASFF